MERQKDLASPNNLSSFDSQSCSNAQSVLDFNY